MKYSHDRIFLVAVLGIGVLTVTLHILAAGVLSASFWGVHFYAFFGSALLWLAPVLLLLGCLPLVWWRDRLGRAVATVGRHDWAPPALMALLGAALFWFARIRHTYLGDGNVLIYSLPEGQTFHPRQPLTMFVQQHLYRLLGSWLGGETVPPETIAQNAVAVGSVAAGALFIVFAWLLAHEVIVLRRPAEGEQRSGVVGAWLIFLLIVTQGYVQLFFGYVENYTFYALLVTIYLWLALRFLRGAVPLLFPAIALVTALAFHLSAAILAPSLAVLAVWALARRPTRRAALRDFALAALALFVVQLILSAIQADYHLLSTLTDVARLAVTGRQETSGGYMFSVQHLRDFFNEQLLIGPLGLFLFAPAIVTALCLPSRRRSDVVFLSIVALTYLGASWVAGDSNLGYARNWDLLAPGGIVMTVAGLGLFMVIGRGRRSVTPIVLGAVLVSIFHTAPWIATNASAKRSFERLKILPLGLGRTEVLVAQWYRRQGNEKEMERWLLKAIDVNRHNNNAYYLLGVYYYRQGDFEKAARAYHNAVTLRPDKTLFHRELVHSLLRLRHYKEAIPSLEVLIEREPENAAYWALYVDALRRTGRDDEAQEAYEKALPLYDAVWQRQPESYETNLGYGQLLFGAGEFTKALERFRDALRLRPDSPDVLSYLGYTLINLGQAEEGIDYFRRCLEIKPDHPERSRMLQWIESSSE